MADQTFDLVVLGGGPGGYVAAIRAAQLGMKTAVVEREHLGGICLNWGCIPTKALLRTSEINHLLHHLPDFGFAAVEPRFEIDKVVKRSRAVAKQLSQGVAHLLRKNKVTVFDGAGKLAGKQTLAVEKDGKPVATLKSPHIILATGARARQLAGDRGGRQADLDLQGGDGAAGDAEVAAGDRLRRDRHRVRQLLSQHGRRGDGGGGAAADSSSRGRGDFRLRAQGVREAGDAHPGRRGGEGREEGRATTSRSRWRPAARAQDITVDRVISAVGIVGNVEGIGLEGTGVEGRPHACGDRRILPHRRAWRVCDRRPGRAAVARAQGEP